jgi:hypothetical protein
LSFGYRSLGLLGRSSDFLIVRGVVIRRQDDGRGALLSWLGSRGLCSSALDDGIVLRIELLL